MTFHGRVMEAADLIVALEVDPALAGVGLFMSWRLFCFGSC